MKRKLQVFISSTYTDLIEERQAAVSAILKAGHIPAGMELFTAGDQSQMKTIERWIDESDVYMLILGGRYGSVEKKSGISYTELEYDYAVQTGKALFAVVITDAALESKVKAKGIAFLEKENNKELALFRTKVLSNISSFFEDEKDIKLCVHESMSDFAANRDLQGWVSASEVTDTQPLFEEIKKLSQENTSLKEKIAELEKFDAKSLIKKPSTEIDEFNELEEILRNIEIKIPAKAAGKEGVNDLLSIFYATRDSLITGITNKYDISDAQSFLYHNICPKLQIYGLISNEKVPGVQYRRSYVTELGKRFLAQVERKQLAEKKSKISSKTETTVKPATKKASAPVKK